MNALFVAGVRFDWEKLDINSWVRQIAALRGIAQLSFDAGITFFAGENGTGKSTLLEAIAIACGFPPEGGTLNYHFSTWEERSPLAEAITVIRGVKRPRSSYFFRAESFST